MLNNPIINGEQIEHCVGRGSFGAIKVFRDILAAVKEYLPRSFKEDVFHEAAILNRVCHPSLPLLIGICTSQQPLRIVMQFNVFNNLDSKTMQIELVNNSLSCDTWLHLCGQVLEALNYHLHEERDILHNDVKLNNIIWKVSLVLSTWHQLTELKVPD